MSKRDRFPELAPPEPEIDNIVDHPVATVIIIACTIALLGMAAKLILEAI